MANEYSYSGRSDPNRSLQLLWRLDVKPGRGPKPGLSLDQIVAAAIEVADAEGLRALSMRRVADRLGVGTMSLYRYVPAKAELLDLMLDAVDGEIGRPPNSVEGWRARLEFFARESWSGYQRHPWVLHIVGIDARPPLGPNILASFEAMLASVAGIGLKGSEMVAVIKLVQGYVQSVARSVVEADQIVAETGVSVGQWWSERTEFWEEIFDVDRFPTMTAVWESGGFQDPEDDFEFGLTRVLDGVEVLVTARRQAGRKEPE